MCESSILIVDDDRVTIRYCHSLLERKGYCVVDAQHPTDALEQLQQKHFDLLITDIHLPVMDGFELITRARQLQPEIAVMVMTGYGSIENAFRSLHRGVDGLLLKPFEQPSDVADTVKRILTERRNRQDAARLETLQPVLMLSERLLAETSIDPLQQHILSAMTDILGGDYAGVFCQNNAGEIELLCQVMPSNRIASDTQVMEMAASLCQHDAIFANADGPGDLELRDRLRVLDCKGILFSCIARESTRFMFMVGRTAHYSAANFFSRLDLDVLVILARQATVAYENALLYSDLMNNIRRVEESQRALVQAEKMAAVGRLMASLAHEINNPLQSVRNCLHLATRRNISAEQRMVYIEMTDSELDRLVNSIRHMLEFYRPGRTEHESVDMSDAVEKVMALLAAQLSSRSIESIIEISGDPHPVPGMSDQLRQVFFNLLINAMDALNENLADRRIWIEIDYQPDHVHVAIEDSGPGVSVPMQENLFEPFISTKKDGTGLGLAVTYDIIERHHGVLTLVDAHHGQGARFEFSLPTKNEDTNG